MLKKLFIRNYILIDELDIEFTGGLTIVTGETGAGKSILLGALALILGQRADTGVLLDKKKKCIIEGTFSSEQDSVKRFFTRYELDDDTVISLRREINAEGKSRAFINDTPVNLNLLRELAASLIDIHSQHETLTLASNAFQLSVVDAFAGHEKELATFRNEYQTYLEDKKELQQLIEQEQSAKKDLDYFQFQFDELEEAQLKDNEQELLEEELQSLTHAEEIEQQLSGLSNALDEEEDNILQRLTSHTLAGIAAYSSNYRSLSDRVKSAMIELKDIAADANHLLNSVRVDPSRLELINERLNTIYRLQQKHRLSTVGDLLTLKNELEAKLEGIGSLETEIESLRQECEKQFAKLISGAEKISSQRMKSFAAIEKSLKKLLAELAMPNAVLTIKNARTDHAQLNADGIDRITFYFSANKGSEAKELGKVASGGEMSRLMLAIKSLLAGLSSLPTVIFDEIDTGISGEVAAKVGSIMQEMAVRHQVIAITHLPQIAGKGNEHFVVYKTDSENSTRTGIRKLSHDERISEIARMLSGQKLTGAAIEHAKELLNI